MATNTPTTTKTIREMNISRKMFRTHMPRRINNSMRILREEIAKHHKTTPESVKIGSELNRYLMMGAINGFYGVKVEIEKTGDSVKVDLAEKKAKIKVTDNPKQADSGKNAKKNSEKQQSNTNPASSEKSQKPKQAEQRKEAKADSAAKTGEVHSSEGKS